MDGSSKTLEDCRPSSLDVQDDEADEADDPSPYDSDTEEVDIDSFVKSLPHDINDWKVYHADNFTLETIGNGFFGEIYKATESSNGDVMVMKAMKKATKMKLMCAEIRLMARLKHPNILRFLGVCLDTAGIHLLTEYMEIGNLEDVVADAREPLPWSLRMKLAHDISKGMAYLHCVGVIHRDLASKNVLISNDSDGYTAVVADFGLAAKIPSRKRKMRVVGSPYWMAPEVLRNDQYNETVDIFSYGIILCEIIGRVHSSPDEIPRTNHFGLDVDKFRELVVGCPPEFLQLAVCCCQVDPQARPPFELTAKFLEYIRQLEIVVGSPTVLVQDNLRENERMSANIEDWISDSRKSPEVPAINFLSCDAPCIHENGGAPVKIEMTESAKLPEEGKSVYPETPYRSTHFNKRHSFFASLRYKYFRPTVATEDLVKNTPSKLARFFNRVLHVQKKHKFDSRKKRSKTTSDVVDGGDRPKLRSFRLFSTHRDRSTSEARTGFPNGSLFCEHEEISPRSSLRLSEECRPDSLSPGYPAQNSTIHSLSPKVTTKRGSSTSTRGSSTSSFAERTPSGVSPYTSGEFDFDGNPSSCESENPYSLTWSESSFRKSKTTSKSTDMNGFHVGTEPIPRCFSESDVGALKEANSNKPRTFATSQDSHSTKPKSRWSVFGFLHRRGKEKHNT